MSKLGKGEGGNGAKATNYPFFTPGGRYYQLYGYSIKITIFVMI